ncbi:NADH-quinone oxidoreductase subunit N [uncultured Cytophaga sp.]|uniref:NADH-quinone oxidoreductase subunit N n=1 Tax=uncultured Cytophaga sp. TaxID=160238 RepID=UPI002616C1BD|nr:NADH-quinone oxidoreductase subunit N [uncultured Cytophaga sp.]
MNAIILISILGIISMMSDFIGLKKFIYPIILISLAGIIGYNICTFWNHPESHYGMLLHDNFSIAFGSLLLTITLFWFLLSRESYSKEEFNQGDHYALILFSTVGGLLLVSFTNMSTLFLGVEILSIPLYILAGSRKKDIRSVEASIKYFILGSFATGIMLLGIALIYGATGSFDLATIKAAASTMPMFMIGITLLCISFAFKISAVPFHFWVPDVYTGSPTFITAFMSTFVKVAAFGAFYHLIASTFTVVPSYLGGTFIGLSAITILAGNIAATFQTNVKRLLAFSGVSQAGYMLMVFPYLSAGSKSSLFVYLVGYGIANLVCFYIVNAIEKTKGDSDIVSFAGLAKSNPLLAFVFTLSLFSLAGIPPAAGFFGKFYLFNEVIKAGNVYLVLIAIVGSIISVYYYFKTIIVMYNSSDSNTVKIELGIAKVVLVVMSILVILIGLFPDLLLQIGVEL